MKLNLTEEIKEIRAKQKNLNKENLIMPKYTNIVGNPIDGFRCIGIFDSLQEVIDWQVGCDENCWAIEIEEN